MSYGDPCLCDWRVLTLVHCVVLCVSLSVYSQMSCGRDYDDNVLVDFITIMPSHTYYINQKYLV